MQLDNISKYALGLKYKIGAKGASECPSGYVSIQSLSGCNEARKEMSISGWNSESFNKHVHRLPYCWVGPGGKANYNSNGDSGSNQHPADSQLICEDGRK